MSIRRNFSLRQNSVNKGLLSSFPPHPYVNLLEIRDWNQLKIHFHAVYEFYNVIHGLDCTESILGRATVTNAAKFYYCSILLLVLSYRGWDCRFSHGVSTGLALRNQYRASVRAKGVWRLGWSFWHVNIGVYVHSTNLKNGEDTMLVSRILSMRSSH